MKMTFEYTEEEPDEIACVLLTLKYREFMVLADALKIYQSLRLCDASIWDTDMANEDIAEIIRRFDSLDGDGEDAQPIEVQAREQEDE